MSDTTNGSESFIKLVMELRTLTKAEAERSSKQRRARIARLESLVDAWLATHAKEMMKLEAWKETVNGGGNGTGTKTLLDM